MLQDEASAVPLELRPSPGTGHGIVPRMLVVLRLIGFGSILLDRMQLMRVYQRGPTGIRSAVEY